MRRSSYYVENPPWQDEIVEVHPKYEREVASLGAKYGKWAADRYGSRAKRSEIHPLADALPTLRAFSKVEASLAQKYQQSSQYREAVDERFPSRRWSTPSDITTMSIDDMELLMRLGQRKKQRFEVSSSTVEDDFVAKVGPWSVWMPTTRENSVVISGFDPVTFEPCTTWCTARTAGSNLFYNYAGHGVLLFYIIRDKPSKPTHWLAVGWKEGKPVFSEQHGGLSVDGKNNGLTQASLKKYLGKSYQGVTDTMSEYIVRNGPLHPAMAKIEAARHNLRAFEDLIVGLGDEERIDLIKMVLEGPVTDSSILEALAGNRYPDIRKRVAMNASTPTRVLEVLALDNDHFVRQYVASNANTQPHILEDLAQDESQYVRQSVAVNSATPTRILEELAVDWSHDIRNRVAMNTSTPARVLEALANDENKQIRRNVAGNTSTPPRLLESLSNDSDAEVAVRVANNVSTPIRVLESLAKDPRIIVRAGVAWNDSTPPRILKVLAKDNQQVRSNVAANTSTPKRILVALAKDPAFDVSMAAMHNLEIRGQLEAVVANPSNRARAKRLQNPRNY